jgi:hypothetical protein
MRTGLGFRYMVITNDNMVYETNSNVQIFIIGGLLNLGARGKELKELSDICEDIYLASENYLDLGAIVDYVYARKDEIENYNRKEWTLDLVGEQW